jgi:LPXTG-motif cell wall-anchored protein
MIFRNTLFIFLWITTGLNALGQSAATIKATVDKNRILIGEPALLTIEVQIPEKEPIRFISMDSIEHFEWLDKPVIDTIGNSSGTLLRGVYPITSFDSGRWVIPSFELSGGLKTDSIPMEVVFSDFDPKADYHDIKDILEADPEKKDKEWWWYVAGGGLLLLGLLVYFLRKKKPVPVAEKPVEIINAWEEALSSLNKLQAENPEARVYHTRLADIFRMYVFRKKGILSLQKTTDDLVLQISQLDIEKSRFDELAQALRLGDLVKFAKFIPGAEDNQRTFEAIKKSIEAIEQCN